jgi:hypothetical protein
LASYQQLQDDVLWYLDRRDAAARIPSWVQLVETEIQQTLRARCMEVSATQPVDSAFITLPPDFCTMASIRDASTGNNLVLKDEWSGSRTDVSGPAPDYYPYPGTYAGTRRAWAYRLVGDCIEFLPWPWIPDPPDPYWVPQTVLMNWYAKPKALILPSDTNPVLEQLYSVYLYGILAHATLAEQDEPMAPQWDAKYQQAVTRANLNTQQSTMSGAPYTEEMSGVFG